MTTVLWAFNISPKGTPRWRTFVEKRHELIAYEDGRWELLINGRDVGAGKCVSLDRAKCFVQRLSEALR